MSSRVLRKLQGEKERELEEVSDTETDTPVGGARRKQLNVNRYDLVRRKTGKVFMVEYNFSITSYFTPYKNLLIVKKLSNK